MKDVFKLIKKCPLKEDKVTTPTPQTPNPKRWYQLGNLAYKLGFESNKIYRLRLLSLDNEKVQRALLYS